MGTVPKDGDAHSILFACTGDKSLHKASVALDENDVSWLPHFREWNQIIYKIDPRKIILPISLESIGSYAFGNCSSLKFIHIPSRVTDISACAFYNCESLNKVDFSYGLRTISSSAFSGCNCLSSLILPDSVEVIKSGKDSFLRMDTLDAITISNRVSELPTFFDTREVKYPLFNGYIDHGWKSKSPPPVSYYDERETYQDTLSIAYLPSGKRIETIFPSLRQTPSGTILSFSSSFMKPTKRPSTIFHCIKIYLLSVKLLIRCFIRIERYLRTHFAPFSTNPIS